jgi:hypothetical protein
MIKIIHQGRRLTVEVERHGHPRVVELGAVKDDETGHDITERAEEDGSIYDIYAAARHEYVNDHDPS